MIGVLVEVLELRLTDDMVHDPALLVLVCVKLLIRPVPMLGQVRRLSVMLSLPPLRGAPRHKGIQTTQLLP